MIGLRTLSGSRPVPSTVLRGRAACDAPARWEDPVGRAARPIRWASKQTRARGGWAAAASGALVVLAAPAPGLWPLAWVALVPVTLALAASTSVARGLVLGGVLGVVANAGLQAWLPEVLQRFGGLGVAASTVAAGLFFVAQGLPFVVFGGLIVATRRWMRLPFAVAVPLCLVVAEWAVPRLFPWTLGATQARVPALLQIAEWTGATGVSALVALGNGALVDVLLDRSPVGARRSAVGALLVVALALAGGHLRMAQLRAEDAAAPHLAVGVVQANVPSSWSSTEGGVTSSGGPARSPAERLHRLQEATRDLEARGADVVVWSETAYPYPLPRLWERDFPPSSPARVARGTRVPILLGAASVDGTGPEAAHFNSAFLLDRSGAVAGRYDKMRLLPFGETQPLGEASRLKGASTFAAGETATVLPLAHDGSTVRLAPLICLEDILPEQGRLAAAQEPHLLVNLTNDAWFGPTAEPAQHFALAALRSVELRLPLVRSANAGPSAVVLATGEVVAQTAPARPGERDRAVETLLVSVPVAERGSTFYAQHGEVFAALCALAWGLGLVSAVARRRGGASAGPRPALQ